MPAQYDLCIGFAVLFRKFCKYRFIDQVLVSVSERIPCHQSHACFCQKLLQFCLWKVRMRFDLYQLWLDLGCFNDFFQPFKREVGETECLDFAFLIRLLHQLISFSPVSGRLVEEQQIDIFRIQSFQCFPDCIFIFIDCRPQFCDKEDIFSDNAALFDCSSDTALIHICICRIDQTDTVSECAECRSFGFRRAHQEDTDSCQRHFYSVIQCEVFHTVNLLFSLHFQNSFHSSVCTIPFVSACYN